MKLRIRTLMIAVAVAGLLLYGDDLRRRRTHFLERADDHSVYAVYYRRLVRIVADERTSPGGSDPREQFFLAEEEDAWRRRADYHESLIVKYERAARYPWLPVAPDPPEPK
jgi:hypothetical protein